MNEKERFEIPFHRGTLSLSVVLGALVIACRAPAPVVANVPASGPSSGGYAQGDPVPAHDTLTIVSAALGEARRINVYVPGEARADRRGPRLPVLYMPDGGVDEDFPHVANTVDSLVRLGTIRPLIVVGIPNTQRRRDLTGPTGVAADSAIAPAVGGSAAFRSFLRDELIPAIEHRYRVSDERGILGESLAGLFAIESFFAEPGLFTHHIAFDPSLWWNGGALVDSIGRDLHGALGRIEKESRRMTVHVSTSGEPAIASLARRLSGNVQATAPATVRWTWVPRAELTHATIFRAAKTAALIEAFR